MNRKEFDTYVEITIRRIKVILKQKGHDYTAGDGPFDNFTKAASFTGTDPVIGIMLRLADKLMRIQTFVQKGDLRVEGETVQDAVDDIIGYALLMGGLLNEKLGAKHVENPRIAPYEDLQEIAWRNTPKCPA